MADRRVRRPVLRSPKKDPQREEVYRWENRYYRAQFYGIGMTDEDAAKMVRSVCRYYKVRVPKIVSARLGKGKRASVAESWPDRLVINKDRAKWTPMLLAHELAHHVQTEYGVKEPDHGPVWLGIYIHIAHHWRIIPAIAFATSAEVEGLKFRDPSRCGPGDLPRGSR